MSIDRIRDFFRGRGKLGCLAPLVIFIILVVVINYIGDFAGKAQWPERYAQIYGCRGEPEGTTYYTNECDEPIHLRYCFYTRPGTSDTACRTNLLQPGEGISELINDRLALKNAGLDIWSTQVWACKLPYMPDMVPNMHKRTQIERGCRKPDHPEAPQIGPDAELQAALDAYEAP